MSPGTDRNLGVEAEPTAAILNGWAPPSSVPPPPPASSPPASSPPASSPSASATPASSPPASVTPTNLQMPNLLNAHSPGGADPWTSNPWLTPASSTVPVAKPSLWRTVLVSALVAVLVAAGTTFGVNQLLGNQRAVSLADVGVQEATTVSDSDASSFGDWAEVAAQVQATVVAISVTTEQGEGEGSGVVLDTDGNILTNNHVVADVTGPVTVTLADGRIFEATVVGSDQAADLAVIRLQSAPADLEPAQFGSSAEVVVGQAVMAVGNPLGLANTVTTGIVSAVNRPVSTSVSENDLVVTNAIQVDAAINPGNSGGPLFNAAGEVIGITSSIAALVSEDSEQAGSIGLGFAIPSDLASQVAAELIVDGTASHAFLGVRLKDTVATADGVTRLGALVHEVDANTPAAAAGLEVGDIIVAIDSEPTTGAESLTAFVRALRVGDLVTLTVVRDESTFEVDVVLAEREE